MNLVDAADMNPKEKRAAPGCQVPEEIVVEILSRLPVKSLCRFKCVCKVWYNLISDTRFVKMQLNQSIKSRRGRCVLHESMPFHHRFQLDYESLFSGHEVKLVEEDPLFCLKTIDRFQIQVWGSCNGLLCTYVFPGTVVLVNPSTRQTKTILSIHCPENKPKPLFGGFLIFDGFGFGYDALHDDYKVVLISNRNIFDVYSLKSSAWRRIGYLCRDETTRMKRDSVHINGGIYWITYFESEPTLSITAFYLSKQEFTKISTPVSQADYPCVKLHSMGGNLCIGKHLPPLYEFWVIKIYGKKYSWEKTVSTFPCQSSPTLLDFPKSEEALIISDGGLLIYNNRDKTQRRVNFKQISTYVIFGFSYVESLVSL
ncbi:hypothetical protein F3Y22_tig00110257pilonHSYRG00100 [Hibiscus syriacus]|uniref:F-box domain-containing protein n=1 Tax=Hibiscus syriacus TaxID=106335 RepID=A0A6A3B8Z0_HIBSY|nr:F-box/kelch-repeat protein At3g06240-like [Hibiscus syriacus]KAE8712407.1 hypothetical protein F3Y22_tig00110257pilonHSYRG00100 [Hibiscus syriacus]